MDAAHGDRAEQHVFAALPDLAAIPRRGLALTLSGVPRAGVASELGLAGAELSAVLATARKALRRTRAQLPSGGRCERAELVLSDRLDGAASAMDERFLDAHLARCARCRTHEHELSTALEELCVELVAEAKPVEEPSRAHLRVVPARPLLPEPAPPEPEPPTFVQELEPIVASQPAPTPPATPGTVPTVAPARHQRIRAALPIAVAVLIAIGLVAAAIALFGYHGDNARAPWNAPNAPVVNPPSLSAQ